MKIPHIVIPTEQINQWWDSLSATQQKDYIKRMNKFNWGDVIAFYCISKYQKYELYSQVHNIDGKKLSY